MATIRSKILPRTWCGYTPSILPRASPAALEDCGYAPSVPPEVQVSLVSEDVRPLPQTVSYDIQSLGKYDVFLNHRGPFVKDKFVAHLYDALCAAGFHPFLDAKSLIKGRHAYKSINEALSGVGVHVAIFSKRYAESKYCLDELHHMLESGKVILPVFYGVEVAHLRRPYDGPFAEGLRKHKRLGRHQDVERWEDALEKVADITGFRLDEVNGDEAQLKRRIVLAVQRALPAPRLLHHRVGLEESLKVVVQKLNLMGDSVGVIGVFGMGGIGKTTLVREVYNHFATEKRFEEQSFLKDVRSIPDPLDLQKELVYDLLQEDLQSSENFSYWFDRSFMGRKVLIVVDDIDHRRQFDVLIPDIDKLARGSRILVTSRYQNVLSNIMRGDGHLTAMHEVELMSPHDSHQLFNWHAFYNEKASDGFQDLARKVADACCRLPLALEVIGAFLFDKKRPEDRDYWHQATETVRANGDILNQLKISYDGLLSDEARLMFKDIACFLIGKDEKMAMQIFESCNSYKVPQVSFHELMEKSLVTLDSDRRIRMHDLLRDMGRNVVTNQSQIEGQRSHLWDPAMAERVLRKNQGTDAVRGLSVAGAKNGAALKAETYTRMSELHFLILDHCQVKGDFSTWSEELRWLQWWSLPLSELPPTLSLLNLSVLDLTGSKSVTRISPKNSNDEFLCKELRMLVLKDCTALEELPQTIGKLSRLKNLDVQGCSTLKALPDSVGELVELTQLNLSNCTTLERLPDTIGLLSKLKKLWLNNCTQLKFLPTEFGKLQRLDEFWADASSLSRLPHSFSQLSNLEDLHLHHCEKIQELPSMSGLVKLKLLHIGHIGVQTLPEDFGHLQNLVDLHLYSCKNLQTLPQNFGLLQLQRLQMNDNHKLKMLPKGFGGLNSLVDLNISNNSFQQGALPSDFGRLSALTRLQLQYNYMVTLPEGFKELQALVHLEMHHCPNLVDVQGLPWSLEYLDLGDCPKLIDIPSLRSLHSLKSLILCNCTSLTQLQDLDSLITLERVNLSGCTMLQNVPNLNHNGGLKACYLSASYISMPIDSDWLKRRNVEQLGMVHQSSSKGNIEVMNYGVNENGDHYLSGMREAQVEDMDSEPENALEGNIEVMNYGVNENGDHYLSGMREAQVEDMDSEPEDALEGADDTFIFQATSLNSVNIQVFKERILTAICDLDVRTFGQNSKLQVNVLQCKYMVNIIVTSKFYLMGETCATLADPIYKELLRIVQKADLIVQECSDEPLNLKSILVEMDNIRAFVAVIFDWQSCTRLFRKDIDNWSWASFHSRLEQLKAQDIQKNKELWDPRIAELRQLMMSNAGGSRTGERINLADYLQWRVQNVMNVYDLPQGLLPWCVLASDPEAKRGEFLGMGTFGSVSQCTWFGMACAEKSFNHFIGEKQKRDFENEVGVMVRLNHPHVVRLIGCHQDSTKCSIVMELMPTNLERHIAERKVSHKPFTPQAAVDVMSQIASAMEYLHGQGVVHRDLKPNNILVSPNTNPELSADGYVEVKLADFGLAKTKVNTSSSMLHSQICGAATWRAPEAFPDHEGHQRRFPPKKADVYSFAILCSQILSGQLYPFGHPPMRLLERISSPQNERPFLPSNSNYPAQLLSLIKQCWEPDLHKRPNFSTICSSLQEIRCSLLAGKWDVN